MASRLVTHRYVFLAASLYAMAFTGIAPFATNAVDRMMLFGSAIWLTPVLGLLALSPNAGIGYRLISYLIALLPTLYALIVYLTPVTQRDLSTFHLVVLFAGFYTLLAFLLVLAIAGLEMMDAYLRRRVGRTPG